MNGLAELNIARRKRDRNKRLLCPSCRQHSLSPVEINEAIEKWNKVTVRFHCFNCVSITLWLKLGRDQDGGTYVTWDAIFDRVAEPTK